MFALWIEEKTVGSHWIPITLTRKKSREPYEKAISLYLNSTIGIISTVACAAPNILSRVNFSLDAIKNIPIPDMTDGQAQALADVFDANAEAELLALADAPNDPVRIALDEALVQALKIPSDTVAQIRTELSREPSVQR